MTSTTAPIILYDLATKAPSRTFSLNPWKIRLALNYKGIDYKTEWVEYPDIKPKFSSLLQPNTKDTSPMEYTLPIIKLPNGTHIMESQAIARALDQLYPSKPLLRLTSPYIPQIAHLTDTILFTTFAYFATRVPDRLLSPRSAEYVYGTRARFVGMPLGAFEKADGEACLVRAEPLLRDVTALLEEDVRGPWFEGDMVGFADFVWIGFLVFCRRVGEDMMEAVLSRTGNREVHLALLKEAEPYLERDDH